MKVAVTKRAGEPSKNFSCCPYGRYVIRVNNYRRKTHGRDIPFTVIISLKVMILSLLRGHGHQ